MSVADEILELSHDESLNGRVLNGVVLPLQEYMVLFHEVKHNIKEEIDKIPNYMEIDGVSIYCWDGDVRVPIMDFDHVFSKKMKGVQ